MAIQQIFVADSIIPDKLFPEGGYDVEQSAEQLADLQGQVIINYLEEHYPGIETCVDIAIHNGAADFPPLEIMVYGENEQIDRAESVAIHEHISQRLAEARADMTWAVRLA